MYLQAKRLDILSIITFGDKSHNSLVIMCQALAGCFVVLSFYFGFMLRMIIV